MENQKPGMVKDSVGGIVTLIAGIGICVLVLIFVGTLGGSLYNVVDDDINSLTTAVINNSVTVDNETAASFAHQYIVNGTVTVLNNSAAVGLGNFTIDYEAGTVLTTYVNFTGETFDFSYTYGHVDVQASINNGILSGFSALEQVGGYTPIIVMALVITIVLSVVLGLGVTGGGKNYGGNTAL